MRRTLAIVLAAAVAGALAGGVIGAVLDGRSEPAAAADSPAGTQSAASPTPPATEALKAEQIYRRDAPGVVVITDTQTQVVPPTLFSPGGTQRVGALGSGFVIDKHGDIVTNDHVVQGATGIRVGFTGGVSYPARVVGADASSDLAVIRVKAPGSALHALAFGASGRLEVGGPVYAIGNPFGLDRTMTAGIVSATGRDIEAPNGLTIPNAIQTDAPINHGNSGGPLLDGSGRVVGVNAQIQGGTVDANVGVGFAIPSDTARAVAAQLIASGHAQHAWLGVQVEPIDAGLAKIVRGLPARGVAIARVVEGSPAAKAGLKGPARRVTIDGVSVPLGGDTIVAVDGKQLGGSVQLFDLVAAHKPGDKLELAVVRGGATRTVAVTLGNVPEA